MKKRVLLRVAYDGTNYHGWQVQPGAVTIEQVLNEKLTDLGWAVLRCDQVGANAPGIDGSALYL